MEEQSKITLPLSRGKSEVPRLISIYGTLFKDKYGFNIRGNSYPVLGKVFKDLLKDYTEIQIAWLLCIFFDWRGVDGNNDREVQWLTDNAHSIILFKSGMNKNIYELYVRNFLGQDDVFDDDEKLLVVVGDYISKLN